jgi:chain length determinant protein EpsF
MRVAQFIAVLRSRWQSAALIAIVTVVTAAAVTLQMKRQYTASAVVMVDISAPDPVAGVVYGNLTSPAYMATQVELIGSERVARRVVESLGLAQQPEYRTAWELATSGKGDYEAWLAEQAQRGLEIKPSRESNVIALAYTSTDPEKAAAFANAFTQAYVDVSIDLRVNPAAQSMAFFDERARQLRDQLEEAQSRLSAVNRQTGIISIEGRLDLESARLAELSTQLVTMQTLAAESSGRQSQAAVRPDQMPEVLGNAVVSQLTGELAKEETRLLELTSRLGDAHPQVIEQRARVGELRSRIEAATARASGSVGVANTINQSRVAQARAALEAQRAKVLELKSQRDEAAVLQRDVENAQRAYDAVLQRLNQTSVESKATQTNLAILKRASVPARHSAPKLTINVALALVIGVALGLVTVLVRELSDRRLRTPLDVAELNQPLLVVLPVVKTALKAEDSGRSRLVKARVLTGLPRPATGAGSG